MKTTVYENDFIGEFRRYGRLSNLGGYYGLRALFMYLGELESDTGHEYELDVIALCCDFTYFEDLADYNEQYGTDYTSVYDIDELACIVDSIDDAVHFITYAH